MNILKSYFIGFALSILCTLAAFLLVALYIAGWEFHRDLVIVVVVSLAIIQLVVQVVFFLHMGKELRLWNISALLFSVLIIVFVVGGSLWIMANLQHSSADMFLNGAPSPQTQID